MRLPYFFLYTEARSDAKLSTLTDAQHRVWFRLLCYAAEQDDRGTITQPDYLVAIEVAGGDVNLLLSTVEALVRLKIVECHTMSHPPGCDRCDMVFSVTFLKFAERQGVKPSATKEARRERKAKSRAKRTSEDVTPCHTPMSHPVTPVTPRLEEIRRELNTPPQPPFGGSAGAVSDDPDPDPEPPRTIPPPVANNPADVDRAEAVANEVFRLNGWGQLARSACNEYPAAWVAEAVRVGAEKNCSSWKFVRSVLERFRSQGGPAAGRGEPTPRAPQPEPVYFTRTGPPKRFRRGPYGPTPSPNPNSNPTPTPGPNGVEP